MMKKMLLLLPLVLFFSPIISWAGFCQEGNCLNGRGVYRWNNGSTFAGEFKDGVPEGEGVFTTGENQKYNVVNKNGKPVETKVYSEEEEAFKERQREARKFNMAGVEFLKKKDYESAIFFFNKAITKWPDNPEFHDNYRRAKQRR